MVSKKSVEKKLKALGFNHHGWGRTEVSELPNILLPDEEIYELVNGFYEGGFALLVSTDVRVLLIDKKPLNYLTVEDLRFDMINEMDYSHRLMGAHISIATGNKNLKFTSFNQHRLRKVITHVQHCMAEAKKQQNTHAEDQKTHLEQINQQLQAYLVAQHQHQLQLQQFQQAQAAGLAVTPPPTPTKPSPELSDFLFAQSLLAQYEAQRPPMQIEAKVINEEPADDKLPLPPVAPSVEASLPASSTMNDLYAEGLQEIFGKHKSSEPESKPEAPAKRINPLEINPISIAYSKLPMALRNKKFGRPSFHAHSASDSEPIPKLPATPQPSEG